MASKVSEIGCHVQRNLACLKELPRVSLSNIKNFDGAKTKAQRRGRGPGSGRGKTSGRGHKGQGQRGTLPRLGFEGGQTPFYLKVPKHGLKNNKCKTYSFVNLNRLQYMVDSGRLAPDQTITMKTLLETGTITNIRDGVKLLGGGSDWFKAKINIEVSLASKSAIEAVEREGGTVTCVYHTKKSLSALLKPEIWPEVLLPKQVLPSDRWHYFYRDPKRRGYLADPKLVEEERSKNRVIEKISDDVNKLSINEAPEKS